MVIGWQELVVLNKLYLVSSYPGSLHRVKIYTTSDLLIHLW